MIFLDSLPLLSALELTYHLKSYLLLPMDSMACHGGPMKVRPASVHFLAKVGFSLNCNQVSHDLPLRSGQPYKAISWMYALTTLLFGNLYYPVPVEICRWVTEIDSVWGA
jgi:hypothetical protein